MKRNIFVLALFLGGFSFSPVHAADATPTLLSPGSYVVNVVPGFNMAMGTRIEKSLSKVPGLKAVSTKSEDSSIHFTVKEKSPVNLTDIQKTLEMVDKGAVMTTPVLAHTLSANPGL